MSSTTISNGFGAFSPYWSGRRNYHHRTFLLAEVDQLSSSKDELRFSNDRTNTFVRLGFQRGTPDDTRSNAIVGESRARIENLFSVYRKIGPAQSGFTAAMTYSFDFLGGDFEYLKAEFSALKRFDLTADHFLIGRVQGGTFLDRSLSDEPLAPDPLGRFIVPRDELFSLGGRENLKGVNRRNRGTDKLQATAELFVPVVSRPRTQGAGSRVGDVLLGRVRWRRRHR